MRNMLRAECPASEHPSSPENLIDIESEDMKRVLFKFYNYVKTLLPNSETSLMVAASKTIGQIADVGSNVPEAGLGQSFLDLEVPAAIDVMQADRQEWSRYAGVLILKELAKNSPVYFHSHVGLVFDKIGIPLKDKRLNVREGAAELLSACLDIVTQRERGARSPYFTKVLQEAQNGLRQAQPEVIHGSLLAYKMLLLHGGMVCVQYLGFRFYAYILVVHEGELLRLIGADTTLQGTFGSSRSEDRDHTDTYVSGIRHPSLL